MFTTQKKKVFIPLFSGIEGKNILRGGIFDELRKTGLVEPIFFVGTHARADYYRKEYPEVTFEVIKRYKRTFFDRAFSRFKFFSLRSKTIDLKRQANYLRTKNRVAFIGSFVLNRICGNRFVRSFVRALDQALVRDHVVGEYFDRHAPSAVFAADLFEDTEISMVREARRRGVPSIGFLSTWDRLTSRWGIRLLPDHLVVFNEVLRDEAVEYAGIPKEKVYVSGAVQLDLHRAKAPLPRDAFMEKLGLPANTKLIVYGPLGRTFDPSKQSDSEMVVRLDDAIEKGQFGQGHFKIVVRFPPNDFVDQATLPKLSHVIYDTPGVRFATVRGQDWDMKPAEIDHLRDLLANAVLVICYYSSLSIDAAVFDVPVININFDLYDPAKRHPYYETTHYSKVKVLKGIRLVESFDALVDAARAYCENPVLDREGRKAVLQQQAYNLDGHSADRIARYIEEHVR